MTRTGSGGSPRPSGAGGSRRARPPLLAWATAALALVGLLVMLYPGTAAWWSQYEQSRVIREVSSAVSDEPGRELAAELDRARAYNETLVSGATLEAGANVPSAAGASGASGSGGDEYEDLLVGDAAGAMGRLRIPAIAADLPIYHGTSDETLLRGVGHLEGTSLPVGGSSQHAVLTAHRGLASAELFSRLDRVEPGDTFTLEVLGEVLVYRVAETRVVDPGDTESLFPRAGEDLVTLVTCTPLGINSHRILVTGERIDPTPRADLDRAGQAPEVPGFPWWAVGLGGGTLLIAGYLVWSGRVARRGSAPRVAPDAQRPPAEGPGAMSAAAGAGRGAGGAGASS